MKLAAVMMVRDEETILATNLNYHRSLGVSEFWVVDNGSEDRTTEILEHQNRLHGDVHWHTDPGRYLQSEITTGAASEAIAEGADWIVAIDADEFWWLAQGSLPTLLSDTRDAGGLLCRVDNFVQRRSVKQERPDSLWMMTYRAEPRGTEEDARQLVESGEIGFVEIKYPSKLILRASADLIIGTGNHTAKNTAGPIEETEEVRVLHAPIRARSTLARRAEFGERIAAAYSSPNTGWHMRRTTQLAQEGRLNAEWAANSQRFGRLNLGGGSRPLVRDLRLRKAISAFL